MKRNNYSIKDGVVTMTINSKRSGTYEILFDEADLPKMIQHCWTLANYENAKSTTNRRSVKYAYTTINKKPIRMHSIIMPAPQGYVIDHRNGNGLDNRRSNLQIVTPRENAINNAGKGLFRRRNRVITRKDYSGKMAYVSFPRTEQGIKDAWTYHLNLIKSELGHHARKSDEVPPELMAELLK